MYLFIRINFYSNFLDTRETLEKIKNQVDGRQIITIQIIKLKLNYSAAKKNGEQ